MVATASSYSFSNSTANSSNINSSNDRVTGKSLFTVIML